MTLHTLCLILSVLLASLLVGNAEVKAEPPNLIVILTDDLAVEPVNALLSASLLPNLKSRLIDAGVTFENAFVTNSFCCPSRATFLRGQYTHNHQVLSNSIAFPGWLSLSE